MKSFQFRLQRVLDWRALRMRAEEEKLASFQHKLTTIIHRETALTAAELRSETGLLELPAIDGADLRALAAFQLHLRKERAALKAERTQCEAQIAEQRQRLLKARRDCRGLEKMKEKRKRVWTVELDREIEATAAEAFLSQWSRTALESDPRTTDGRGPAPQQP
jgi:flagellar export protein FliJ